MYDSKLYDNIVTYGIRKTGQRFNICFFFSALAAGLSVNGFCAFIAMGMHYVFALMCM